MTCRVAPCEQQGATKNKTSAVLSVSCPAGRARAGVGSGFVGADGPLVAVMRTISALVNVLAGEPITLVTRLAAAVIASWNKGKDIVSGDS